MRHSIPLVDYRRDRRGRSVTERPGGGIVAPAAMVIRLPQSCYAESGRLLPDAGNAAAPNSHLVTDNAADATNSAWHNHYFCDACPMEWDEYAAFDCASFCPCCDEAVEPYDSVDLREDA